MTSQQAIRAIQARIEGRWDDAELQLLGPLSSVMDDIERLLVLVDDGEARCNPRMESIKRASQLLGSRYTQAIYPEEQYDGGNELGEAICQDMRAYLTHFRDEEVTP